MSRSFAFMLLISAFFLSSQSTFAIEGELRAPDSTRLHENLVQRIGRADLLPVKLDLGGGLSYTVVDSDESGIFVTLSKTKGLRIPWRWKDLGPQYLSQLYRTLPATPENLYDLANFCFDTGLEEEAHDCLRRLLEKDPRRKGQIDGFIAKKNGVTPPASGYVYFDGGFVTGEERQDRLLAAASAWLIEKQAVEDERNARAEDLFEKAIRLERKGFFLSGVGFMRKVANMAKGKEIGIQAAELSRENGVILVSEVQKTGRADNRVDVYLLGDGYVLKDKTQNRFQQLSRQVMDFFFRREAFTAYAPYFSFHCVNSWSKEDGVDTPTSDASTAFGGKWSGAAQGQVTVDGGLVFDALDRHAKGWDSALVMVRRGGGGTGGGRIAAFAHASPGIAFHEFGHSFVGLLDEYSTQVTKKPAIGPPPVGVNLTDSPDPERCPWKHWLDRNEPGIGIYQGGAGRPTGVWHPSSSCVMGTGGNEFCAVCREAFVLRVYDFVRPVDEVKPPPGQRIIDPSRDKTIKLTVTLMKPLTHALKTTWTLRGKPVKRTARKLLADGRVQEVIELTPEDMKLVVGYETAVVLDVEDPTPWVIKDPRGRLKQKLTWRFKVETDDEKRKTKRTK